MNKKYELTDETKVMDGIILHRIRALIDFDDVKAGDLGGLVENENNLDYSGNAWICGNARICGDARICGNARIYGDVDYLCINVLGANDNRLTVSKSADGQLLVCHKDFKGDLEDFEQAVKDCKFAKEYLMLIEFAKIQFKKSEKEND